MHIFSNQPFTVEEDGFAFILLWEAEETECSSLDFQTDKDPIRTDEKSPNFRNNPDNLEKHVSVVFNLLIVKTRCCAKHPVRVIKNPRILFNVQQRRRKLTTFSDIIPSLISLCVQVQTTGVIASRPLAQVPMVQYQRPLPTAKISQKVYFPSTRRNQVNPSP